MGYYTTVITGETQFGPTSTTYFTGTYSDYSQPQTFDLTGYITEPTGGPFWQNLTPEQTAIIGLSIAVVVLFVLVIALTVKRNKAGKK
jgi:hypothetical protein